MNYPLISEYIEAIKSAEYNYEELSYLRPVLGDDGQPVLTSGNFAVVFKMKDKTTGKFYALKCFTKEQTGRAEAYHQIADALKDVDSPYLVSLRYLDKELFVDTKQTDETEFPVLLMDWVEGKTLDKYLRENLDDKYALEMLAYRFSQLAQWLIPQPFAHGDLKPDNILVREDGTLVLVDYDGMYVPAMKGQKARELGSPDFRHPLRTENDFDEHIDDFPMVSILLSLKAISHKPFLLEKYGAADRLLFSKNDYCDISKSKLIKEICPSEDKELNNLIGLFLISDYINNADEEGNYEINHVFINIGVDFNSRLIDFMSVGLFMDEPYGPSDEEFRKAWTDEYGVKYNDESKELLKGIDTSFYVVKKGTIAIDSWAFYQKWKLKTIELPSSLKYIRFRAFSECTSLETIKLPDSIKRIGDLAFMDCNSLNSIILPKSLTRIGEGTFRGCRSLKKVVIPNSVTSIGKNAFAGCSAIKEIFIPKSVVSIGFHAFIGCKSLKTVILSGYIEELSISDFAGCSQELKIIIPKGLREKYEKTLLYLNLFPEDQDRLVEQERIDNLNCEVTKEDLATGWVDEYGVKYSADRTRLLDGYHVTIKNYVVKKETKVICNGAFVGSLILENVVIPEGVLSLGANAFAQCYKLKEIVIPSSVSHIIGNPFAGLQCKITCHSNCFKVVTTVNSRKNSFYSLYTNDMKTIIHCGYSDVIWSDTNSSWGYDSDPYPEKDKVFVIPDSVEIISMGAFLNSELYQTLVIHSSIKIIEKHAFLECPLKSIILPDKVDIDLEAFIPQDLRYNRLVEKIIVPKGSLGYYRAILPFDKERLFEKEN